MTQRGKMLKALKENVIPLLMKEGFCGKYPYYKRKFDNRIEMLGFITNKYGGAFNIEISTIFLNCDKEMSNYYTQEFETTDEITVNSTIKRYRLKGMFDGWFYYADVYKSKEPLTVFKTFDYYESVSESKSQNFIPKDNQVLVQSADDFLYSKISDQVNLQMKEAYSWWNQYNTPQKMKKCKSYL